MFRGKDLPVVTAPGIKDNIKFLPIPAQDDGAKGGAAIHGDQNEAPSFSSFDPQNDTFFSVMSIYNTI